MIRRRLTSVANYPLPGRHRPEEIAAATADIVRRTGADDVDGYLQMKIAAFLSRGAVGGGFSAAVYRMPTGKED